MPSRRQVLAGAGVAGAGWLGWNWSQLSATDTYYDGQDPPDTEWWPQPRFDRMGTCFNPRQVGPREGVRERWSVDVGGPSARPVVADGTAYFPTAGGLLALDARSGEERWRVDRDQPRSMWPYDAVFHDGLLYVASGDDPSLLALDAESGDREWTFHPDSFSVTALLVDPRRPTLFAGDYEGNVYGLDPATGEVRWESEVFGVVTQFALGIPGLAVGTEAGEVHALYPDDGRHLWRRKLPGRVRALATANGRGVFAGVFGGPTVELDTSRAGGTTWRSDRWTSDSFALAGNTLFTTGGRLTALDVRGGDRRWTGGRTTQCGPAMAGDTVYAASETDVSGYAFRGGVGVGPLRVGAKRWSHPVEGRPEQGFAVADDALFFMTEGGGEETRSKAYALESA
ncbi:PQQ-binding-like beta-propeller repeat protein [Halobium salinum]|uniref:PQQ-binding-like beta-propeller repeat protein n=1 Tax=Halobium salinum TaxID=1364940 RepID=A0ABD5P9G4_9EURY|nr:PQQ-binding-like beta-propeller repeat protein [Halobium salinum]